MSDTDESKAWPDSPSRTPEYFDAVADGDVDPDECLKAELRAKIIYRVGTNDDPTASLSKSALNSVYAFLTGEYPIRPKHVYKTQDPDVPPMPALRRLVLGAAGDTDDVIEAMNRRANNPRVDREYVHGELATVVEAIQERGDQRPVPNGGGSR